MTNEKYRGSKWRRIKARPYTDKEWSAKLENVNICEVCQTTWSMEGGKYSFCRDCERFTEEEKSMVREMNAGSCVIEKWNPETETWWEKYP